MPYFSLYRRWRPLTFKDMMGQEHITRTLSNALIAERLAHAYLFCGPRGTGKTTAAKILSRAMNCEKYPVAEPCGQCTSCKNIASGVSLDVIEMDAASNRGIDEIRELRERSRFSSGEGQFKVYIIDEAHMLTPEACNAFLKTLEEPPQKVVFILATTDPSKLPSTIVSRCQRFDFHLLTVKLIRERLDYILKQEGWQAEPEALDMISRLADGSLRDALGVLEQCSAYGEEQITAEQVRIVTGATRSDVIEKFLRATVDNDLNAGLTVLEEVVFSGRDLNLFMRDFTFVLTRLLIKPGPNETNEDLQGFDVVIKQYRGKIEQHLLLDAVELLHEAGNELRHAHFPRYILEIAFIRLLRIIHGRLKPVSVWQTIQKEEHSEDAKPMTASKDAEQAAEHEVKLPEEPEKQVEEAAGDYIESEKEQPESEAIEPEAAGDEKATAGELFSKINESWPAILSEIKKRQKTTAAWLEPSVVNNVSGQLVKLVYAAEYEIHKIRVMEDQHRKLVESVLSSFCGMPVNIKAETGVVEERKPGPVITEEQDDSPDRENNDNLDEKPNTRAVSAEDAAELFGGTIIEED